MGRPVDYNHPEIIERRNMYWAFGDTKPSKLTTETLRKICALIDADPEDWKPEDKHIDKTVDARQKYEAKKRRAYAKNVRAWLDSFPTDVGKIKAAKAKGAPHWVFDWHTDGAGTITNAKLFIKDTSNYFYKNGVKV